MTQEPVSATERAAKVDWTALSPQGQDTVRRIVVRLAAGWENAEIGEALGISRRQVGRRLGQLRREIREQLDQGAP